MSTGIPRAALSFFLSLAFSVVCTRASTARGCHDEIDWCTRTAISALASEAQCDLPVNPRGFAPSIALRHLPHADQRVGPVPHHQLLQVPDLGPVLLLRRLRRSAAAAAVPAPPVPASRSCPTPGRYVLLPGPVRSVACCAGRRNLGHGGTDPGAAVPIPGWRSCNPSSRLTCPLAPAVLAASLQYAHLPHVSARFRAWAPCARYPASYAAPPAEEPGHWRWFLLLPRPPHSLPGHPVPPGACAPLTIGLPCRPQAARTRAGFPCSARMRGGWDWASSIPRGRAVPA